MWSVSHRLISSYICFCSDLPLRFRANGFPLNSLKLSSRQQLGMEKSEGTNKPLKNEIHAKSHEMVHGDPQGRWDKCWEQGRIPWDLKQPTPVILHLHQTDALPRGRALVPGCGTGYDVVAIASPDRYVVGLEISDHAVKRSKEGDFFTWKPTELFDLIFDYTFFCAIEPSMRPAWASQIQDFLKPDGELITLMFPISDHVGGPPYKVSVADYEEVLHPMGFKAISIVDNELAVVDSGIGPRKVSWICLKDLVDSHYGKTDFIETMIMELLKLIKLIFPGEREVGEVEEICKPILALRNHSVV